jgi:hypothetical protein
MSTSMSGHNLKGKLIVPHENYLGELDERRHASIRGLWERYKRGEVETHSKPAARTRLELIQADDLLITTHKHIWTDTLNYLDVCNAADPGGVNFMGYDKESRCLAFRGETQHWNAFIDFATSIIRDERVLAAFKAPSDIRIPHGGLEAGLEYDEFASRVEIVEYAMWLKQSDPHLENEVTWSLTIMENDKPLVSIENRDTEATTCDVTDTRIIAPEPAASDSAGPMTSEPTAREPAVGETNPPYDDTSKLPNNTASQTESDAAMAAALAAAEQGSRYRLRARQGSNTPAPPVKFKVTKRTTRQKTSGRH